VQPDGGRFRDSAQLDCNLLSRGNVLVALDHCGVKSGMPSYKSTAVLLRASPSHEVSRRLVEIAK
jgi:hypothetical protein